MRKLILIAVILILMTALQGCAVMRCAKFSPGGWPIIEIDYSGAGDGSPTTCLRIYRGTFRYSSVCFLEFEPIGSRRRCVKVAGPQIEALLVSLRSEEFSALLFAEIAKGNARGLHQEFITIKQHGNMVQRQPRHLSPELRMVLMEIEELFRSSFPLIEDSLQFSLRDY